MARPRRQGDETALFVRIPSAEADKLHRAANALGAPKRELITRLVAQYVDPEKAQLAGLLQVEEETIVAMAERKEIPARKVGEDWRFSREAVLAWLAEDE